MEAAHLRSACSVYDVSSRTVRATQRNLSQKKVDDDYVFSLLVSMDGVGEGCVL